VLGELHPIVEQLRVRLATDPQQVIVMLASGDPLFYGIGRLLLQAFAPEQLVFHPHLSAVQLACSRLKLPWQDACVISVHGRSLEELQTALRQGADKIIVLTDPVNTPLAIAQVLQHLDLSTCYQLWVCENLGGDNERILRLNLGVLPNQADSFAPLNVVVLVRQPARQTPNLQTLPCFGIADREFLSFPDRPGLMTKREIRVQILAELALQPGQVIWDVGAGTGSVSIEIARLVPDATIYAIEKTAIGLSLIQQNAQRFQVQNVRVVAGEAPKILSELPSPDRIFIGGSGGQLSELVQVCLGRLALPGVMVIAVATLEHQAAVITCLSQEAMPTSSRLTYRAVQLQIAHSRPMSQVKHLQRWQPLNPVTLVVVSQQQS
jgi:precorrin-6Y C5,15-methyltransferase (decarboxylating)